MLFGLLGRGVITSAAAYVLVALAAGCLVDPVLDEQISELGPEDPAVPAGPAHRPNQPCVLCHSAAGREANASETIYSVAGTVYRDVEGLTIRGAPAPRILSGIEVQLIDITGRSFTTRTNCAGNFYVKPSLFSPSYPMWVAIKYGGEVKEMESPVRREGSCAFCHLDPAGAQSAGHVWMTDDEQSTLPTSRRCTPEELKDD